MRLWHVKLIPYLPRLQLLSQNRECAAMRGLGWGKKHSVVNYVFKHNYIMLYRYHMLVIKEMQKRGYKIKNVNWFDFDYRGLKLGKVNYMNLPNILKESFDTYPEHNEEYLKECITNLTSKMQKEPWKYKQEDFNRIDTFMQGYTYAL